MLRSAHNWGGGGGLSSSSLWCGLLSNGRTSFSTPLLQYILTGIMCRGFIGWKTTGAPQTLQPQTTPSATRPSRSRNSTAAYWLLLYPSLLSLDDISHPLPPLSSSYHPGSAGHLATFNFFFLISYKQFIMNKPSSLPKNTNIFCSFQHYLWLCSLFLGASLRCWSPLMIHSLHVSQTDCTYPLNYPSLVNFMHHHAKTEVLVGAGVELNFFTIQSLSSSYGI